MPSILIAYPIDNSSLILADKLNADFTNEVSFFMDPEMNINFMNDVVSDIKSTSKGVGSVVSKVFLSLCCNSFKVKNARIGETSNTSCSATLTSVQSRATRSTRVPSTTFSSKNLC